MNGYNYSVDKKKNDQNFTCLPHFFVMSILSTYGYNFFFIAILFSFYFLIVIFCIDFL